MLPPSPDRFAPRLTLVESRARTQVELRFDEDVDASRVRAESLTITGDNGETLAVMGVAAGRTQDRVLVRAGFTAGSQYLIRGRVPDRAGNFASVRARFVASARRDTFEPRVTRVDPTPGAANQRLSPLVRVRFNEAMDTAQCRVVALPGSFDTLLRVEWENDWQALRVTLGDSLRRGQVAYVLAAGLADLEGNRARSPAFTYFTADSVFRGRNVHGRAVWRSGIAGCGIVFFNHESSPGMAPIGPGGAFGTSLMPGTYRVQAVVDTNYDWVADLSGQSSGFSTAQESLEIRLEPVSAPDSIGAYRR
jgi:hypothetical protein